MFFYTDSANVINDDIKNDPFQGIWEVNFQKNFNSGIFNDGRSKPLVWLKNSKVNKNLPCIIISAGPSLSKNIDLIRDHQDGFLIICVDVVYQYVKSRGITPDIVIVLDAQSVIANYLKSSYFENTILCLPTVAAHDIINVWGGKFLWYNIHFFIKYKRDIVNKLIRPVFNYGFMLNWFCVTNVAIELALLFNPVMILLVGADYSFTRDGYYYDDIFYYGLRGISPAEIPGYISKHRVVREQDGCLISRQLNECKNYLMALLYYYKGLDISSRIANCTEGGVLKEIYNSTLAHALKLFSQHDKKKGDIWKK
jgi:hypothetical protein